MKAGTVGLVLGLFLVGCGADAVCGNAVVEGSEDCDDGNDAWADGCNSCTAESGWECDVELGCSGICGDGALVNDEVCDPTASGPVNGSNYSYDQSEYCNADCSELVAWCGDGARQTTETCDDGNDTGADGCYHCQVNFGHICDLAEPAVCRGAPVDETLVGYDLTLGERSSLCEWYLDLLGGPSTSVTCNGYVTEVRSVLSCAGVIGSYLGQCTVEQLNIWVAQRGSACGIILGESRIPYC